MKHFRLLSFLLLLIPWSFASSQSLSVVSFRLLDDDATARTPGTMMYDQNGDLASLIKVVTPEKDFSFDVGIMGVVGTSQKQGEVWVYVPSGVQRITITHSDLGVLRDYYFPIPIERARTYELVLTSEKVSTVVEDAISTQYVVFNVTPNHAVVYIDDDGPRALNSDGMMTVSLKRGIHTYRVSADKYITESDTIDVQSVKHNLQIKLKSAQAMLTVQSTSGSTILINDSVAGVMGGYSLIKVLNPGKYVVEARKPSHTPVKQEITLDEQEHFTISLEPIPIYGSLLVKSNPSGGDVYLNNEYLGTTPLRTKMLIGNHVVRIVKAKYQPIDREVIIAQDSLTNVKIHLDKAQENEYVDLGLSVKWATCNIGAESPEGFGDLYAWGETKAKSDYSWWTYKMGNGLLHEIKKYSDAATLKRSDDVAGAIRGGKWRMPTKSEFEELISECEWTWTTQNDVKGYKITGKNGNSIFLPATIPGDYLVYWSNSCPTDQKAFCLRQKSVVAEEKYNGFPVRPVHP